MVFQQELAPAEADEAVGPRAIFFRQGRSAGGQTLQLAVLGFSAWTTLGTFFRARGVNRRGLSERGDFFADVLFGCLPS